MFQSPRSALCLLFRLAAREMDDPWGNAWASTSATASVPADDPWKPVSVTSEPIVSDTAPTWEPPAWPSDTLDDDSAAIWNTGAQTPTDDATNSEPAADIEPDIEPAEEIQAEVEVKTEVEAEIEVEDENEDAELGPPPPEVPAIITSPSPPRNDVQLPGSPEGDGFGMFETAVVSDTAPIDDAWAGTDSGTTFDIDSSRGVAAETPLDGTRGLWGPGPESAVSDGDEHDEWAQASARQRLEEERERRFVRHDPRTRPIQVFTRLSSREKSSTQFSRHGRNSHTTSIPSLQLQTTSKNL